MSQPVFAEREVNDWCGFCIYAFGDVWMEVTRLGDGTVVAETDTEHGTDDETHARSWGQAALAVTGCI